MVGLGVDLGDIADYVAHNDLGTAVLLRALAAAGFAGPLVLASSMVVYGEGRYRCAEHGIVRPPPRAPEDLDAGRFEPPCPRCGRDLEPEAGARGRAAGPAQRLRRDQGRAGAPVRGVRARDGRDGRPRCATTTSTGRGCRATRRTPAWPASSAPRSRPAARRACSRTARSGATSCTCATSPPPTCSRSRPARRARSTSPAGTPRTVGEMAAALARAIDGPAPEVTGEWRGGDVRHVFASPQRAATVLGFRARRTSRPGCASSRARSCARDAIRRRRPRRVDRVRRVTHVPEPGEIIDATRVVLRGGRAAPRSSPSSSRSSPATSTSSRRSATTSAAAAPRRGWSELGVRVHAAPRDAMQRWALRPPRRRRRAHDHASSASATPRTATTTCRGSGSTAPTPSSSPAATRPRCARRAARGCSSPRRAPPRR